MDDGIAAGSKASSSSSSWSSTWWTSQSSTATTTEEWREVMRVVVYRVYLEVPGIVLCIDGICTF